MQERLKMPKYKINPATRLEAGKMPIKHYIESVQPYVTCDEELVQRIFDPWVMKTIQSYLLDLVSGNSVKDLLLLADIEAIKSQLEYELEQWKEDNEGKEIQEALSENIDYFQKFIDNGFKYLLIDGKHRDEVIRRTFKPNSTKEQIEFQHEDFNNLVYNEDGIAVNMEGLTFPKLPEELQQTILNQPMLVTYITAGGIKELQKFFVTTNSGLELFPMEVRICSMSIVSRFIRDITSGIKNPNNNKFFKAMKGLTNTGKKSLKKKGHMLLVSQMLGYYLNCVKNRTSSVDYTSDDYLDGMFEYSFNLSKNDRNIVSNVVKTISLGALGEYEVAKKKQKGNYVKVSWADWINNFIMVSNMLTGKTPYLTSIGKRVGEIKNYKRLFHDMTTIIRTLEGKDLLELDSKGNPIPKINRYGKVTVDKKGNTVYIENEHSFKRKNSNNSPKNIRSKQTLLLEEIDKYFEEWNNLGILTLVESSRSQSLFKKRQTALKQNMKDVFTDEMMSWGDVDTAATANSHITAHAEGGEDMGVGDSKANLHSKTEKVY